MHADTAPHTPTAFATALAAQGLHPADAAEHLHANGQSHPLSHKLMWGAGIALAAFIALPYFGNALAGSAGELARDTSLQACGIRGTVGFLAPAISGLVAAIPGGVALATGGWVVAGAALAIGLAGNYLANYLQKREQEEAARSGSYQIDNIHWSKVVRSLATATSIFISLPGILTGITMGMDYLATLGKTPVVMAGDSSKILFEATHGAGVPEALEKASLWTRANIGGVGMEYGTVNGLSGGSFSNMPLLMSHVASCGGPLLGLGLGNAAKTAPASFVERVTAPVDHAIDGFHL